MKDLKDLTEYIEVNGLEMSRYFSEEETIPAIIGHNEADGALVYEYNKLVECFAEHFKKYDDEEKSYEEYITEAEDWISVNTLRSLPYKEEGYVNPIVIYGCQDWDDFCKEHEEYKFDAEKTTNECLDWIREWFDENGKGCSAILGMSGGKDSTIIAALCAEALGKDRVIGVAMPDEGQSINEADKICEYLGIKYIKAPIHEITSSFNHMQKYLGGNEDFKWSEQAEQNIPPRIRMTMLYALAQTYNARVVCCDNASERYIGYSTLFGDNVGSFAPLLNLTVTEVRLIGHYLGLPEKWVEKVPDDGLPHSTSDEEKIGYSYSTLDKYIRTGECLDGVTRNKIIDRHNKNVFKTQIVNVPSFNPKLPIYS